MYALEKGLAAAAMAVTSFDRNRDCHLLGNGAAQKNKGQERGTLTRHILKAASKNTSWG